MRKLTMKELNSYKSYIHDLECIKENESPYDLRVKRGLSQDICEIFSDSFARLLPQKKTDEDWIFAANSLLESNEIYEDKLAFNCDF